MALHLIALFLIPLLGCLIIALAPMRNDQEIQNVKLIGLGVSIVELIQSVRVWWLFDESLSEYQFLFQWNWLEDLNVSWTFGLDGISLFFILLTTFLIPICLLASFDSIKFFHRYYLISFLVLELLLVGVFSVLDILGFYIFFEGTLIPMFLIIGIWGARQQKITAAMYFFFYTLVGSLLMLLAIIFLSSEYGTTDLQTLLAFQIKEEYQIWLFLAFFASFAVKIPMIPFHIWLPLAHVEAPLAGSVVLAGILIKLGSYGLIRFSLPLFPYATSYFTPLVLTLSCLAVVYASLATLRQTDLKRIIAYSSVSHMGVIVLGIFTLSIIGLEGSIFLQIAHGFVSSALFIVVTLLYERAGSRLVRYFRGVTAVMPLWSIFFLLFTLANIAVPLSCNFIGEFLCLIATFEMNAWISILGCLGMVLSAGYALFLYNRVAFGSLSSYLYSTQLRDLSRREFWVLFPLAFFTVFLGVYPNIILETLHPSIVNLLEFMN